MTENLVSELLREVPELGPVFDEHVRDNDILLPHVFFGDVTRWFVQLMQTTPGPVPKPVLSILGFFERALAAGDPDVQNLIGASFVENLEEFPDVIEKVRELAGPRLRVEFGSHEC